MNVYIVTDEAGSIVGSVASTAEVTVEGEQAQDVVKPAELVPARAPGQTLYRVELPRELEAIESAAELHEALVAYDIQQGAELARLVRRATESK